MKIIFPILFSLLVIVSCNTQKDDNEHEIKNFGNKPLAGDENNKTVTFPSGRDSVAAYFNLPKGNGPFPALIVLHEQWGLNDWIRNNADAFSNKGYAALAIDLYKGHKTNKYDEAQILSASLTPEQITKDLKAAYNFLENNPLIDKKKIAVIGWGMGGSYIIPTATALQHRLKAAAMIYGRVTFERRLIRKINCPLLAIFGETDRGIPLIEIQNFEQTLNDLNKEHKIIIYRNVGHGFMNPNNKDTYNREIMERAWREIFSFLEKNL